jgi:DNA-directed RNA polymerase sigma subunit (sigma70/sigma32)
MEEGHDPEPMTLEEIADFVGASAVTLHRIEQNALKKIRNKMLNLKS